MSKTINLTNAHDAVIDQYIANESTITKGAFDQLATAVKLAVAWYAIVATKLFKMSGLAVEDYQYMRGGTFHGLVTGTKEHALRYTGKRIYPSASYCTRAFALHYMHTSDRLVEYRNTNTAATLIDYVTWLQVMYGTSTGEHAALVRNAEGTIGRFTTTPATKADKAAGRAFHTAVLKETVRDNDSTPTPTAIRKAVSGVVAMSPAKRRNTAAKWDMSTWDQNDLIGNIEAAVAQYMINDAAEKAAKAKPKAKVTA